MSEEILDFVDDFPEGKVVDPDVARFCLRVISQQKKRSYDKGYSDGAWAMLCLCVGLAAFAAFAFGAGALCLWLSR